MHEDFVRVRVYAFGAPNNENFVDNKTLLK